MKRWISLLMSIALAFSFSACGSSHNNGTDSGQEKQDSAHKEESETSEEDVPGQTAGENGDSDVAMAENKESENVGTSETDHRDSHVLIAYFTVPEDIDTSGVDAIAGASIVVRENEKLGNTEYVAKIVQQTIGGDLFQIETTQQYPLDHDPLVDQAAEEQDADARPELSTHIENLNQYDTVILGFPNWWGDLPQPLYTFLEEYDLGGKTIIPFVTHGGSGFSDTRNTIADLQPDAQVSDNALSLSRNDVADSEAEVVSWAESLGVD